MPWNDNANSGQKPGPWGSPPPSGGSGGGGSGDGPGGGSGDDGGPGKGSGGGGGQRPPKRPGNTPPDFNDIFRQIKAQFDKLVGAPGGGKPVPSQILAIVGGLVVVIWAASGIYFVQPNEQAVVTTFGAFTSVHGEGPQYRLPFPFQAMRKVTVTDLQRTEIGGVKGADKLEESLMLTGDENIVDLAFTVQWRRSDPAKYSFNMYSPDETVKAVGEAAMREVVGRSQLVAVTTNGRDQIQQQTQAIMQNVLNSYDSGVTVVQVLISKAAYPPQVVDAFRDVAAASQDKVAKTNVAQGEAAKQIQQALGYKAQVVQEALGEAARFNQVYEQYKLAPAVTRQRLYIETMERVLKKSNKVIVDNKGASAPIILPPDAFRPRVQAATPLAPDTRTTGAGR